jgi:hypothetical protein
MSTKTKTMTDGDYDELRWVADNLRARPDEAQERFARLLSRISGRERATLETVLREMIADATLEA